MMYGISWSYLQTVKLSEANGYSRRKLNERFKAHWYLKGTTPLGLLYRSEAETGALYGYSDADWGGDCNNYKSTTGYL